MAMVDLILASASPRRQALIRLLQWPVRVRVAGVDETLVIHPDPAVNVVQTAQLKAEAVAATVSGRSIIIAADTTVAIDGEMLNKPANEDEARLMLQRLRGRTHQVYTGLALINTATSQLVTEVSTTDVTKRDYSYPEIEKYVASGDPLDKAGAYAIQHAGFQPVSSISGCYAGVVGLPLCRLANGLRRLGIATKLAVDSETSRYQACATCRQLMENGA